MRQDAPAPRRIRAAFGLMTGLMSLLCLLGAAPIVRADITLDTLVGFGQNAVSGSRYRPDAWNPVTVYISGQGARGVGQLQLMVRQGERITNYSKRVSLHDGPINEVVNFTVLLQTPNNWGGGSVLSIQAQLLVEGRKIAEKHAAIPMGIQEESFNLLALTKDGGGLNFLVKKRLGLFHRFVNPASLTNRNGINPTESTEYEKISSVANSTLMYTLPTALPASAQGYDMVDAIALADMPLDNLSEDQIEAMKGYVRGGGTLILSGGSDISRLKSSLYTEMLPLENLSVRPARDLNLLAGRYREPLPLPAPVGVITGRLRPGSRALLGDLVFARPYGTGTVVFTAFDYLDPTVRAWKSAPSLWRDLLRCNSNLISPRRTLAMNARYAENSVQPLADAMAGKQATNAPPMLTVTIFMAAYLLLLVPVSYFILKKMDRRELAWFTSPLLILSFTVISYLIALSIKGGTLTVNRVVVLETAAGSDQVAGYGQMTLYSPRRAGYDISMAPAGDPNSPYRAMVPGEVLTGTVETLTGQLTVDMDTTAVMRGTEVRLWDKRSFDTPVAADLKGKIDAKTQMIDGQNSQVTVTNNTRYALHDCTLLSGGQSTLLGDLRPGETKEGTLKWIFKDFISGLTLITPVSSGTPGQAQDSQNTTKESPARTRQRLQSGLISALSAQNANSNGYNNDTTQTYGRSTNALIGWFDDSLLNVQVDGKSAGGEETNLLFVHLPPPSKANADMQEAMNPFLQEPVYAIQEDVPGKAKPNVAGQGIYK